MKSFTPNGLHASLLPAEMSWVFPISSLSRAPVGSVAETSHGPVEMTQLGATGVVVVWVSSDPSGHGSAADAGTE